MELASRGWARRSGDPRPTQSSAGRSPGRSGGGGNGASLRQSAAPCASMHETSRARLSYLRGSALGSQTERFSSGIYRKGFPMTIFRRTTIFAAALLTASVAATAAISHMADRIAYPAGPIQATPAMIAAYPDLF